MVARRGWESASLGRIRKGAKGCGTNRAQKLSNRRSRMSRLSRYVLDELAAPTALFALLMTTVVWLTQSLRLLDLVINRGQSAPTFVYLTFLILPSLLVIILPIAFFAGTLYALNKLSSDSELVVMWASGFSKSQLALPVFV